VKEEDCLDHLSDYHFLEYTPAQCKKTSHVNSEDGDSVFVPKRRYPPRSLQVSLPEDNLKKNTIRFQKKIRSITSQRTDQEPVMLM
jgi:hypothetical protein